LLAPFGSLLVGWQGSSDKMVGKMAQSSTNTITDDDDDGLSSGTGCHIFLF
jgi:hypothetical protein